MVVTVLGTRLFLKNGKDTLLFKSQGLKETTEIQGAGGESCDTYKLQQYSLKMAASDTDYFQINYYTEKTGVLYNDYEIYSSNYYSKTKTYLSDDYVNYYPIVNTTIILNTFYDSIKTSTNSNNDILVSKPNKGILKVKTSNVIFELIK